MASTNSPLRDRLQMVRMSAIPHVTVHDTDHQGGALSHAQEHLWSSMRLHDLDAQLNRSISVYLDGPLKVPVLRDAISNVVARHQVLRTVFHASEQGVRQVVKPAKPVALPVIDLKKRKQSRAKLEKAAVRQMNAETERPFDLETGPVFRAVLYRISEKQHLFHFVVHHLVSDDWADRIFLRDLAVEYRAMANGESATHPELPMQYVDFVHRQRDKTTTFTDDACSYWQDMLRNPPRPVPLPVACDPVGVVEYTGRKIVTVLPKTVVDGLKLVGRQADATLFMTLLAGFQVLLHRYTGEDDVVIGTPVVDRSRRETRDMLGLFLNTVPIRIRLGGNPTFIELLGRVREQTLNAFSHQETPLSDVLKRLGRTQRGRVLFNVMLQLRSEAQPPPSFGGVRGRSFDFDAIAPTQARLRLGPASGSDLALDCVQKDGTLVCSFEYNGALVTENTVTQMARHLTTLLGGIVQNPKAVLTDLPLMTHEESKLTVDEWCLTSQQATAEQTVYTMIEAQASAQPDACAVVDGDRAISYDCLMRRANAVATRLQSADVGPGQIVGLCVPRSVEMVIGLLGILKSGAAYLPMDPDYPPRRLAFMFGDAAPVALVSMSCVDLGWTSRSNRCRLRIDLDDDEIADTDVDVGDPASLDDLAYVMYTSGSTGQPKGVMVQHRALSSFTQAALDAYNLDCEDRVLQFASLSFDSSVEEIFPTLVAGATIVLRRDEMTATPHQFFEVCGVLDISVLNLPTAYWHELVRALADDALFPESVDLVIIGGEPVSPHLLNQWHQHVADVVRVVNTYGPTEATVVSTLCEIAGPNAVGTIERVVPIGKPLPHVFAYVLDANQRPVPSGVIGDLYVSGAGVAHGYLGHPELTAKSFLQDPFRRSDNARMYRTGDSARYRTDGMLEFCGRVDGQIKLRGHRVELGEVEQVLEGHGAVKAAVAAVRADTNGANQLVAYVIPAPGCHVTVRSLRDYLSTRVPEFMVPQLFAGLASLPVNRNGKIDRNAMPDPSDHTIDRGVGFVRPKTDTQEVVARIWSEFLETDRIGANDNLFDVGGNSHCGDANSFEVAGTVRGGGAAGGNV